MAGSHPPFRDQPLPEERLTPLAETKGVFRIDCDRLGDIGDRLVEFPLFRPRHTAADIGPRVPGIDLDRLGVVGQRRIVFIQTVVGDATVVVGPAIFRIDLDRLGAIRNGGDVVLLALVCLAPVRNGGGVLCIVASRAGGDMRDRLASRNKASPTEVASRSVSTARACLMAPYACHAAATVFCRAGSFGI
jgi:hypothetical protein